MLRLLLRWELGIFMSLDALAWSAEELAYWARSVAILSRRMQAMLPHFTADAIRAELARLRARRSWTDWDDEERTWEAEAWKRIAPSPS